MKVAISQSNYIPWKGYFDLIASVDEFILFDDMQYTRRDWRNRNKIKTPDGLQWLTVPVKTKGKFTQKIYETELERGAWQKNHWEAFVKNYSRSKHFEYISEFLKPLYKDVTYKMLSDLNKNLIIQICEFLGIKTKISNSSDFSLKNGKSERLVDICLQIGAVEYISAPAAKNYLDLQVFRKSNIEVSWFNYSDYPKYEQLWGDFEHQVSIIDLLFNCGNDAKKKMKFTKYD